MTIAPADCIYIAFSTDGKAIRFWTHDSRAAEDWSADNGVEMIAYCATTAAAPTPATRDCNSCEHACRSEMAATVQPLTDAEADAMIPPNPERYYLWTGSERRVLCDMMIRAHATWATAWGVRIAAANEEQK